jgi:3-oxosteroid 1-dehydrogenase
MGTLEQAPYYAVQLHPGAMGTKGGPKTDVDGRVLRAEGGVVPGLYAVGNAAASVAGPGYPGAGMTIGASMTFGYLAAKHAMLPA